MEKKLYFLFLEKGCADCAPVFARLDSEKIAELEQSDDSDFEFHVVLSFTNNTTEELLGMFNLLGKHTPVLLRPDGSVTDDADEIIAEMERLKVVSVPS